MIFNQWFWLSVAGSVVLQAVQWSPPQVAQQVRFEENNQTDWVAIERTPAIDDVHLDTAFEQWANRFPSRLDSALSHSP